MTLGLACVKGFCAINCSQSVDWHFNAGLWKFDGYSAILFGILGFRSRLK